MSDEQNNNDSDGVIAIKVDDEDESSNRSSEGILLKQTLMSHNECFLYQVPPLLSSDGYRANDWNLASPILQQDGGGGSSNTNRTINLGFGFRDRDIAIDLLSNVQQFQKSIEREINASQQMTQIKSIPKLKKDETMHINFNNSNSSNHNKKKKEAKKKATTGSSGNNNNSGLFLLKKPPPSSSSISSSSANNNNNDDDDGTTGGDG
ncbi:hypothetical protein FRACYDRAFT_253533 [Fragilariopsis cylindrus CCMP1102]|uniref:NECAP PHear domain-containing protein n=1 Tax=Fragilariopsis cylindrus CCMP1102 TaxID=635003 RepID=A0A1E7EME4_9STRA|nr:hypothetical protein FRACYDRAFT_253533 [Fragilariopsis cylindrus CCMP1102]|eukprot:OEU06753.1 hypothetical protein FRACYDRAFT_253533 [Fragilariopsis cylindrus CCMP1102]